MPWSHKSPPDSMKNLEPKIRNKAVDIANALYGQDKEEGEIISIAIAQAKKWAVNEAKVGNVLKKLEESVVLKEGRSDGAPKSHKISKDGQSLILTFATDQDATNAIQGLSPFHPRRGSNPSNLILPLVSVVRKITNEWLRTVYNPINESTLKEMPRPGQGRRDFGDRIDKIIQSAFSEVIEPQRSNGISFGIKSDSSAKGYLYDLENLDREEYMHALENLDEIEARLIKRFSGSSDYSSSRASVKIKGTQILVTVNTTHSYD